MQQNINTVYGLWGALVLLLVCQALWALFLGYPAHFEKMLRRGRAWVYVPLHWKGFRKTQILFVSRLLAAGVAIAAALLLVHHAEQSQLYRFAIAVVLGYGGAVWLQGVWHRVRYRQQEDAYYLLHDELRLKMEGENKDFTPAQLRSLASYQHQQRLRKADEEKRFLAAVRAEARRFRLARPVGAPSSGEA